MFCVACSVGVDRFGLVGNRIESVGGRAGLVCMVWYGLSLFRVPVGGLHGLEELRVARDEARVDLPVHKLGRGKEVHDEGLVGVHAAVCFVTRDA